jgi:hypothetical protein
VNLDLNNKNFTIFECSPLGVNTWSLVQFGRGSKWGLFVASRDV